MQFRRKFVQLVRLKELQQHARPGGVLEQMQTLKQSRLSVSRVSRREWEFIMGLVDGQDGADEAGCMGESRG